MNTENGWHWWRSSETKPKCNDESRKLNGILIESLLEIEMKLKSEFAAWTNVKVHSIWETQSSRLWNMAQKKSFISIALFWKNEKIEDAAVWTRARDYDWYEVKKMELNRRGLQQTRKRIPWNRHLNLSILFFFSRLFLFSSLNWICIIEFLICLNSAIKLSERRIFIWTISDFIGNNELVELNRSEHRWACCPSIAYMLNSRLITRKVYTVSKSEASYFNSKHKLRSKRIKIQTAGMKKKHTQTLHQQYWAFNWRVNNSEFEMQTKNRLMWTKLTIYG